MKTKLILALVVVVILGAGGFYYMKQSNQTLDGAISEKTFEGVITKIQTNGLIILDTGNQFGVRTGTLIQDNKGNTLEQVAQSQDSNVHFKVSSLKVGDKVQMKVLCDWGCNSAETITVLSRN